jgi:SPP1 family phage portal protein
LYDTEGSIRYFIQSHGSLVEDFNADKPETHSFRGIPIIEFAFNRHKISLIDAIKDQASAYDSILSFAADENEGIAHTIAVLKNGMGLDQGEFERMLRSRMIELPDTGDFQFISKDAKTDPMEKFLDRMERLMYDTAQVVNMSDKDFTAAQSGVAIMLKTFGMSNLAKTVQDEFRRGYKDLLKCIEPIIAAKMGAAITTDKKRTPVYTLDEWDIQFSVNVPLTMTQSMQDITLLKNMDIVDDETLLSLIDFVSDPLAILEKKEIQDREKMGLDYLDLHEEE